MNVFSALYSSYTCRSRLHHFITLSYYGIMNKTRKLQHMENISPQDLRGFTISCIYTSMTQISLRVFLLVHTAFQGNHHMHQYLWAFLGSQDHILARSLFANIVAADEDQVPVVDQTLSENLNHFQNSLSSHQNSTVSVLSQPDTCFGMVLCMFLKSSS